jgi:hypothetical protein
MYATSLVVWKRILVTYVTQILYSVQVTVSTGATNIDETPLQVNISYTIKKCQKQGTSMIETNWKHHTRYCAETSVKKLHGNITSETARKGHIPNRSGEKIDVLEILVMSLSAWRHV